MRGGDERSGSLFSYVDLDARVGRDHPLRTIREIVNAQGHQRGSYSDAGIAALREGCSARIALLMAHSKIWRKGSIRRASRRRKLR
jgi:hypothetical protein